MISERVVPRVRPAVARAAQRHRLAAPHLFGVERTRRPTRRHRIPRHQPAEAGPAMVHGRRRRPVVHFIRRRQATHRGGFRRNVRCGVRLISERIVPRVRPAVARAAQRHRLAAPHLFGVERTRRPTRRHRIPRHQPAEAGPAMVHGRRRRPVIHFIRRRQPTRGDGCRIHCQCAVRMGTNGIAKLTGRHA